MKPNSRWLPASNGANDEPPRHPFRSPDPQSICDTSRSPERKPTSKRKKSSTKKVAASVDNHSWWESGLNKSPKYEELVAQLDKLKEQQRMGESYDTSKSSNRRKSSTSDVGKPPKSPKKPASKGKNAKKQKNECKFDDYIEDILAGSYRGTIECQDIGIHYKIESKTNSIVSRSA